MAEVNLGILVDLKMGDLRSQIAAMTAEFQRSIDRINSAAAARGGKGNLVVSRQDLDNANTMLVTLNRIASVTERVQKLQDKEAHAKRLSADLGRQVSVGEANRLEREINARSRLNRLIEESGNKRAMEARKAAIEIDRAWRAGGQQGFFTTQDPYNNAIMRDVAASVRGMPQPALAGGMGVFGPQLGQSGADAIASGMAARAGVGAGGITRVTQEIEKATGAMDQFGRTGKFAVQVLEAFILYRGFVFVQQGLITITKQFAEVEHQISLSMTQLENFGQGMRGMLTRGVFDVARESGKSFQVVAEGLYQITSAGYEAEEALRVLNTVSKAAVAGNVDLTTAFESALTQMNVFGEEAGDLEQVLDKQFVAVRRGIFSYEQFATQVAAISVSMFQAGQSIETTNAALTAISQVFTGPQLARGATALRQLALALSSAPEKFQNMGVEVHTASGEIRDLIPILEDMGALFDTMTDAERGSAIKAIIPDRREQQAVLGLIENMDSLKLAYVEQQLSLGTLGNMYEVVSGDISVQAGRLRNSIQTGFVPLVQHMGKFVGFMNKVEGQMPGFTSGLIGMATAATALGVAMAFVNKNGAAFRLAMSTPIMTGRFGTAMTPLRVAGALGGAAFGMGLAEKDGGFDGGRFAGSLAAGAAMGSLGGAPGMAMGAMAGGLAYAVQTRIYDRNKAKEIGETIGEAFGRELEASGSVARAFQTAVAKSTVAASTSPLLGALGGISLGSMSTSISTYQPTSARVALERGRPGWARSGFLGGAYNLGSAPLVGVYEGLEFLGVDPKHLYTEQTMGGTSAIGALGAARIARARGIDELSALNLASGSPLDEGVMQGLREEIAVKEIGAIYDDLIVSLQERVADGDEAALADLEMIQASRAYAISLAASKLTNDEFAEVQRIASDATLSAAERSFKIMQLMGAASSKASGGDGIFGQISGNFAAAADIFGNLGTEGTKLADVFQRIATAVEGFGKLKALQELSLVGGSGANPAHRDWLANQAAAEIVNEMFPGGPKAPQEPEPSKTLSHMFNPIEKMGGDFENIQRLMAEKLEKTIDEFLASGKFAGIDEALAAYLSGETVDGTSKVELGSNSLADALFGAAEAVRYGLIDSAHFTANELEMLGEEFADLNKVVKKIGILKELDSIAEFFGIDFDMEGMKASLEKAALLGGTNIKELLTGDSSKLLDFIDTLIEFGDVNVDNSVQQNFVIRISGDVDPARAGEFADKFKQQLMKTVSQAARQGLA